MSAAFLARLKQDYLNSKNLTLAEVKSLCPSCANKMAAVGMTHLDISNLIEQDRILALLIEASTDEQAARSSPHLLQILVDAITRPSLIEERVLAFVRKVNAAKSLK